jgi:hypothetical protein
LNWPRWLARSRGWNSLEKVTMSIEVLGVERPFRMPALRCSLFLASLATMSTPAPGLARQGTNVSVIVFRLAPVLDGPAVEAADGQALDAALVRVVPADAGQAEHR